MTSKLRTVGSILFSRHGAAILKDAGYYAIGAGMLTAGLVGLRDFAPHDGAWATFVQSTPLLASAAGAAWAILRA